MWWYTYYRLGPGGNMTCTILSVKIKDKPVLSDTRSQKLEQIDSQTSNKISLLLHQTMMLDWIAKWIILKFYSNNNTQRFFVVECQHTQSSDVSTSIWNKFTCCSLKHLVLYLHQHKLNATITKGSINRKFDLKTGGHQIKAPFTILMWSIRCNNWYIFVPE